MHGVPRAASDWPSEAPVSRSSGDLAGFGLLAPIRRAVEFERVLRTRPCAISTHFAVHHVAHALSRETDEREPPALKLSTGAFLVAEHAVDDLRAVGASRPYGLKSPGGFLPRSLGLVVPKRHARRAVTRTLLKREMRLSAQARAGRLAAGLWVVRLRAAYDRVAYRSAASAALQRDVRSELDELMGHCLDGPDRAGRLG